jgi:hypothetical protein
MRSFRLPLYHFPIESIYVERFISVHGEACRKDKTKRINFPVRTLSSHKEVSETSWVGVSMGVSAKRVPARTHRTTRKQTFGDDILLIRTVNRFERFDAFGRTVLYVQVLFL